MTAATLVAFLCATDGLTARRASFFRSRSCLSARPRVFIDGEAGTTGLQVMERLATHAGVEVVSVDGVDEEDRRARRKDASVRRELINSADAVVLCLPDDAAREAVALVAPGSKVKIVDASTAHRVGVAGWEFGFAEMCAGQRERIRTATRVANPGCYATGFISLIRPLVDAGLVREDARLCCSAISGYSGGGKPLVALHETSPGVEPWGAYGFGLAHKHLPEMAHHSHLKHEPVFLPAVGNFAQGMVVSVLLHYDADVLVQPAEASGARLHDALARAYENDPFVQVHPLGDKAVANAGLLERDAFLDATKLNGSNKLEVFVFANEDKRTAVLCARLDNLGKGASGAAVQNMNIMLGLPEDAGLQL